MPKMRVKLLIIFVVLMLLPTSDARRWVPKIAAAGGGGSTSSDNFNRANETPLAGNWTSVTGQPGTLNLSANAVSIGNAGNDAAYYYTGTWANDQTSSVEVTASNSSAGAGAGPVVRAATGANTFYRAVVDSTGNYEVGKVIAGTFTSIRTGTVSFANGLALKLSITGTTLTLFYNGTQVGATMTDSSIASGKPGIGYSSTLTATTMDNWVGTQ
jgi:hypothetical protein